MAYAQSLLERGRGVTDRGVTAPKSSERFSEIFRGFQRFLESDFLFKMVKKVLRSAEKFSEPFPLSPLPLYPSPIQAPLNTCLDSLCSALAGA